MVAKKNGYELKTVPIGDLEANDWNPQNQDAATFNRLREEIRNNGCIDPMEVIPLENGKYRILGGEHRWKASMAEGLEEVPVIVLTEAKWKDVDLQKFVTVRLNMIRGDVDPDKFLKLYNEMADKYGANALQDLMGFTDSKKYQKLMAGVTKAMRGALPKDMHKEFDEKAKTTKTVEELAALIEEMFSKYGDTVEQSFMIFTHGKREHIYIAMDHKMKRAMEKVTEYCKLTKEDINSVMAPVVEEAMKAAEKKLAEAYGDSSKKGSPN